MSTDFMNRFCQDVKTGPNGKVCVWFLNYNPTRALVAYVLFLAATFIVLKGEIVFANNAAYVGGTTTVKCTI